MPQLHPLLPACCSKTSPPLFPTTTLKEIPPLGHLLSHTSLFRARKSPPTPVEEGLVFHLPCQKHSWRLANITKSPCLDAYKWPTAAKMPSWENARQYFVSNSVGFEVGIFPLSSWDRSRGVSLWSGRAQSKPKPGGCPVQQLCTNGLLQLKRSGGKTN